MKIEQPKITEEIVQTLFQDQFEGADVNFGFVSIPAGEKLPKEGTTSHEEHEYSFILKGALSGESGGKPFTITEGQASYIPAGEPHWCVNEGNEACELVYALVKV
ncbi:cupin domain-containing protein [Sporosarcina sp. HYO08]|uniref:cupin domain-containing protein n=1 Tax=Sporosarcina sp. HYO08 TaxID=1759557 RepID=UPI00079561D6|nr:cupin domain-containing protein [Sporosarcina sp. HYO08]KXH80733.1 cupin [Sporosarcina sp. HYO08]